MDVLRTQADRGSWGETPIHDAPIHDAPNHEGDAVRQPRIATDRGCWDGAPHPRLTRKMGVLLLGADYYGTLAAARAFGRAGLKVTMADQTRQARALYSRHVTEKLVHPPLSSPRELIDWLVDWGTKNPGT